MRKTCQISSVGFFFFNSDGSSSYVVTIGAVSCTFGGVAITSAAAMVFAMLKKKGKGQLIKIKNRQTKYRDKDIYM